MVTDLVFVVIILAIIAFFSTAIGTVCIDYFRFFVEGQKYNFTVPELNLLWKVAKTAEIKNRTSLFWSVPALHEAISIINGKAKATTSSVEKDKLSVLLSKLYDFRTKLELEEVQKKRGLESSRQLKPEQVCVLVFANFGQFYVTLIENNAQGLKFRSTGEIPKTFNFRYTGDANVYLWRKGDAGYLFRTAITDITHTNNATIFSARHSKKIIRTQKRKSVRAKSNFAGLLFPQHPDNPINVMPETINGVRCVIKDISEDGALVLVKGKCVKGMRAKLQFTIGNNSSPIVMYMRVIRFVYSTTQNVSRLHLHCEKISAEGRNAILSYVYEIGTGQIADAPLDTATSVAVSK